MIARPFQSTANSKKAEDKPSAFFGFIFFVIFWVIVAYIYGKSILYGQEFGGIIFAIYAGIFSFMGGTFILFLLEHFNLSSKYMLYLNPITVPLMILYEALKWYYSSEQKAERAQRNLRKIEDRFKQKILTSILNEGKMLTDEELVNEELELSSLDRVRVRNNAMNHIQKNYLEYIRNKGSIDISDASKEFEITELQLINILNYSLKIELIKGHFTIDKQGFKTIEYITSRINEELA